MSPHKVPVHLQQPDGIGKFSLRQIFLGGAAIFYIAPAVWQMAPANGPAIGGLIHSIYPGLGFIFGENSLPIFPIIYVVIACTPFLLLAMPFDPPVEHGLMAAIVWVFHYGYRSSEKYSKDIGNIVVNQEQPDQIETDFGTGAAWEIPGANLRLADQASVEM